MYYRLQDPQYLDSLTDEGQVSYSYVDGSARAGKSVMDSIEELAHYLATTGVEFDGNWVLVELDGTPSDDEDEDAHLGVELIHPTEILNTWTFDEFLPYLDAACDAAGIN